VSFWSLTVFRPYLDASFWELPRIVMAVWLLWWGAVLVFVGLSVTHGCLTGWRLFCLRRQERKARALAGEPQPDFGITLQGLTTVLKRREQELTEDMDRLGLDFEARQVLANFRQVIQQKIAGLDTVALDQKASLLGVRRKMEDFQPWMSAAQVSQAQQALEHGGIVRAENFFKQVLAVGKREESLAGASDLARTGAQQLSAAASYQLGILAEARWDFFAAAQYYHQAAELHPKNTAYLATAGSLACSLYEFPEAERLFKIMLKVQQQTLGPEHPEVAITLAHLGALCHRQGKHGQAEAFYQWAMEISQPHMGVAEVDMVLLRENYAALLRDLGRHGEVARLGH
jgi:tetratricopeptide (TPR) repeat protein